MYQVAQVYRVREFLTGQLLATFLDLLTLAVLLPFLFWLNAPLAWVVLLCAGIISVIILAYLKPMREMYSRVVGGRDLEGGDIGRNDRRHQDGEGIGVGAAAPRPMGRAGRRDRQMAVRIRQAVELAADIGDAARALHDDGHVDARRVLGDGRQFRLHGRRIVCVHDAERAGGAAIGGLARLVQQYEEVSAAIGEAGAVLNRPLEIDAASGGLRPKFAGAISFQDVTFTYAGTKIPALSGVSFSIPAGTMLGIVGKSGSGKSTIARLLQGINRDYSGFLKIDGADLREINLRHLRQSLGVVLQDNFLFRGSIRDNIISGRPGLTLPDAVNAARLAGAEEFIERMPNGYETYVEEGSPNLSGGQKQRIAIARALIHDPRLLILDEATSALDPESEAGGRANPSPTPSARTMVIVSHRLASLTECDQILFLEQGKMMDIAPPQVLLERCAIYRHLWAQQHRHMDGRGPRGAVTPRLVRGD